MTIANQKQHRANRAAQHNADNDIFPKEEPGFSFVTGYTAWSFPYGTTIEEDDAAPSEDEALPF